MLKRKKSARKGDSGKVLVIGGSSDYVGAVALAGIAALRSGCDWVTVFTVEKVGWTINCLYPDLVVKKVKGTYLGILHLKKALSEAKKYDTILIGNGIGLKSNGFVKAFVKNCPKPMVIDADALKFISINDLDNSILTPHSKELAILMDNSKVSVLKELQKKLKNNILLAKGPVDKIISKDKIKLNKTGNPGMTKAGTGDVLAGLAAGIYAQTNNAFKSAILAAHYNGKIGDLLLKKKKGYSFLASDMVDEIKRLNNMQ